MNTFHSMANHTITLDTKDLERLTKLVYLGHWMVNAIRTDDRIPEYESIERLILKHAHGAGLAHLVQYDHELKEYFPTQELELDSDVEQFRQDYDNEVFWDELFYRLVDRDVEREHGRRALRRMTNEERWRAREPHEEHWDDELGHHGVDRLGVVA